MNDVPNTPAPGYYPDGTGLLRYWDGSAWTEQTQRPSVAPSSSFEPATHTASGQDGARPWFKKKRLVIPGALVALLIIGSALGGGGDGSDNEKATTTAASTKTSDDNDADVKAEKPKVAATKKAEKPRPVVKKAEKPKPKLTSGQENALRAAENYLSFAPFSRDGLIEQLSSEYGDDYSKADATFAADHVDVNFKDQAAKAAKNYLDISPFSRAGLIEQLSSSYGDKYTREQAEYGVEKAGL